jgi:hypothetical protein
MGHAHSVADVVAAEQVGDLQLGRSGRLHDPFALDGEVLPGLERRTGGVFEVSLRVVNLLQHQAAHGLRGATAR